MPVVHNISVNRYSVKSNLEGDYYVLYACTSSSEIDKFVENIVSMILGNVLRLLRVR